MSNSPLRIEQLHCILAFSFKLSSFFVFQNEKTCDLSLAKQQAGPPFSYFLSANITLNNGKEVIISEGVKAEL